MDWLNYHHLRYFWMVAREGSLRRAAEKLSVSQPSISAQVRLLEEALGDRLFRRSGRGLSMTESGRIVFDYAEEIFSAGRELLAAMRQRPTQRSIPFHVGVTDSLPKLAAAELLRPLVSLDPPVRMVCREGHLAELLSQLAHHRLDLVLADEPAPSMPNLRTFNHPLGDCGVSFCAEPKLAGRLRRDFPQSLDGAPALLPTEHTPLRRSVERWFETVGVRPRIIGEFDDSSLLKSVAIELSGFFPLHAVAQEEAVRRYGFREIGVATDCRIHFHAITAERRMRHPATLAVTAHAHAKLFSVEAGRGSRLPRRVTAAPAKR